jgi:hypothetical protein
MADRKRFNDEMARSRARIQAAEDAKNQVALPTFAAPSEDEARARHGAVGLLTVEEFKNKREAMAAEKQRTRLRTEQLEQQQVKRVKQSLKARLSFQGEEEEDGDDDVVQVSGSCFCWRAFLTVLCVIRGWQARIQPWTHHSYLTKHARPKKKKFVQW